MLSLKHIAVNSFNENIVYLHKDCNAYKLDDIKNLTKVEVHGGSAPLFAFLEIVNDPDFVSPDELGLNTEAFTALNLPEGANVNISLAGFPPSLSSVQRKVAGNILSSSEYSSIIRDITDKRYSNMDISSFLVASGSFMTASEVLSLTEALVGDDVIRWDDENIVVDHHCLGGVPGNKTDIIITAIVAAYGLPIPKTASRSLTSCAGVADTFSVLANVDISEDKLHQLIKEHRGAIADYNTLPIAPASKIIASVERAIGITQQQHIVAETWFLVA